jgi:hypothetical protein
MQRIFYLWDSFIPPYTEFLSVKIQHEKSYVNLSGTHFCDEPNLKIIGGGATCFNLYSLRFDKHLAVHYREGERRQTEWQANLMLA